MADDRSHDAPPDGEFEAARERDGGRLDSDPVAATSTPETNGSEEGPPDSGLRSPGGSTAADTFPIVGIGASAGGLRAFQDFFSAVPPQPDMAFVLVQHLSPDHESALAEIIQSRTQMAVNQVTDPLDVRANCVYVIPPGKHLELADGHLRLVELERKHGKPTAVDHFFRSLAREVGERSVGVILSGTGSDGSLGIKAIKEAAGLTLAQSPESAEYDGMPTSAIRTGRVDVTGTPADLAGRLVGARRSAEVFDFRAPDSEGSEGDEQALRTIFAHLRRHTGHDFTHYKRSTILRRLSRRLQVHDIETLPAYASFLRRTPGEADELLRDFLISVTQFFRDPDAFELLEQEVIPALFRGAQDPVRVWVPGCATGEEAYSIAMLLCEQAGRVSPSPEIQVFATDIDEEALAVAREGAYPGIAAADLSQERLARFFDVEKGGIRVKPELREIVMFARHNLVADPPFSRLDLVSCRNVLIYFNREIQQQVFAMFHYALRPDGYLFLGSSESPETVTRGFAHVDKKARVYRRRDGRYASRRALLPVASTPPEERSLPTASAQTSASGDLLGRYNQWTLEQYAPPRLLVDEGYDLTHVLGRAGDYLRHREGPVTPNVVDQVIRAFRIDLRTALHRAFSKGESVDTPFRRVEVGGEPRVVRLHVGPVQGALAGEGLAEVVFIELDPASVEALDATLPVSTEDEENPTVARLEDELRMARSRLQAIIEEREASNEELKASNEELQSMNEELQSTTEELETSQEELQSMNEELATVNQELKNKIEELTRANSDLQNLMASTEVGILFLDRDLRLKRYTPSASKLFNLIASDVGRPFEHVSHKIDHDDLPGVARRVLDTLQPAEETVEGKEGRAFLLRAGPYRTLDDRIDGVVLTFVDVTEVEQAKRAAAARAEQQSVVADLGEHALQGIPSEALFDQAVRHVRDVLGADACKVLRYEPDDHRLRLVAGVGWKAGAVGTATVPDATDSQAGYTLAVREPVLVPDLSTETRFAPPALLTDHDLRSGMSVVIPSPSGDHPFGVLGVHSGRPRGYSAADGRFLQSVANILADAVEQERKSATIRRQLRGIEAVYETAPVGLAYVDRNMVYRRVNERLAAFNGVPADEHVGRTFREIVPELADEIEPVFRRVLERGESVEDVEGRGHTTSHPDEERVWLCSYVPQRDSTGRVEGLNAVVVDVTEREEQEAALAQAAAQIRLAIEGGRLGIWSYDIASNRITFDKQSAAMFDVTRSQTLDDALKRIHPDDRPTVVAHLRAAADPAGDGAFVATYRHVADGETVRWVTSRARVQFDGDGDERQAVRADGVVVDVTALKTAEEQARRQLSEIESYFQTIPVGIAVFDTEGRYVRANARLAELVGTPLDELIGQRPAEFLPSTHVTANQPHLNHVLETGEPALNVEMRLPIPARPAEIRDWLVSFYPIEDEGERVGASVVVHDVTAFKRVQEELTALTVDLEDRVARRTQEVRRLAADLTEAEQRERRRVAQVLHDDLQQILYALQVKLQLVERALDEAAPGDPADALAQADRLLDDAIQSTRNLTVDLSPPVLRGEGLERTIEWLAYRMGEAYGLRVTVDADAHIGVGSNVHVLLYQAVRELLFNVVKHAGKSEAHVHVRLVDGQVEIEVEDEGAGFVSEPADAVSGFAGFGLFSIRERLQLAGGTMEVGSAPGEGTWVRLTCPAQM